MEKAYIISSKKGKETEKVLIKVAKEHFNLNLLSLEQEHEQAKPLIRYGINQDFNLNKSETCDLFCDIIKNTKINNFDILENEIYIFKTENLTGLSTGKYIKKCILNGHYSDLSVYRFIQNKTEYRINFSFGKVNNILNKNIQQNDIFGKADITNWKKETDKETRAYLIDITKKINQRLIENGLNKIQNFGLDIIKDNDTNEFYFLELNRCNALNEENAYFFIKGFVEQVKQDQHTTSEEQALLDGLNQLREGYSQIRPTRTQRIALSDLNELTQEQKDILKRVIETIKQNSL